MNRREFLLFVIKKIIIPICLSILIYSIGSYLLKAIFINGYERSVVSLVIGLTFFLFLIFFVKYLIQEFSQALIKLLPKFIQDGIKDFYNFMNIISPLLYFIVAMGSSVFIYHELEQKNYVIIFEILISFFLTFFVNWLIKSSEENK